MMVAPGIESLQDRDCLVETTSVLILYTCAENGMASHPSDTATGIMLTLGK
jgi:hypothetical protein